MRYCGDRKGIGDETRYSGRREDRQALQAVPMPFEVILMESRNNGGIFVPWVMGGMDRFRVAGTGDGMRAQEPGGNGHQPHDQPS